jgi:hypothetical protein
MAQKRTYRLSSLTIGSKVYVVHKKYAFEKKIGGKVLPAKVVAFINVGGTVQPEFKIVGYPNVVGESTHTVFTDVKKAIHAIKS